MSPILIYLTSWLDHDFCVRVALTMLHFLWQGIALGLLVYLSTRIFMRYRASVRYCVNLIALSSMMICVPLTYAWLGSKRTPESSISLAAYSPVADRLPVASFTLESGFTDDTPVETPAVVYTSPAKLPSGNLKSLPTIATVLYLTGAAIMTIRLLLGLWGGHRLQRCSVSVVDPALLRMLECQARRLGIRFQPAVAYCSRATAPVVVGILRPTILLPISLASGLTPDQLETIFMHELAHIRRRDLIVNLFQRVAESLLFFHPAVWYVSRRLSLEREHCCDDVVIDAGYEHLRYAGALVRMAELCCGSSSSAGSAEVATLAATGDSPSQLKQRVVRLLDQEPCVRLTRRGTMLAAFVYLFLIASPAAVFKLANRSQAAGPQAVDAQDETELAKKRSAYQVRSDRRTILKGIEASLEDGKHEQVTARFTDELRNELPAEKLKKLWNDLITDRGPMRRVDAKTTQRIGVAELYLIHLEWPENYLDLRIDFDDQDRITGLWIDTPIDGEAAFEPKGGLQFGPRIKQIAAWNRTLEVKVENTDGTSAEHCVVAFYRELKEGEDSQSSDWKDASGSRSWRHFAQYSGDGVATATRLAPGWYRVIAGETSTTLGPLVASDPIQLDEASADTHLVVRFDVSGAVRLTMVAADDGSPLPDARVTLEPLGPAWPPLAIKPRDEKGVQTFDQLPAGKYRAVAYQRTPRWDGLRYEVADDAPPIEVVAGETKDIELQLMPRRLTDQEIATRVPWVVNGRVTDSDGRPMAGVAIWASAGWGSLRSSQIATTDEDGRYSGRFGTSGWVRMTTDGDAINIVSAQVGAYKQGFAEANINRHGGTYAGNRMPRTGEEVQKNLDRKRLFTPGVPVEIDFVMKPAAVVTVSVMDDNKRPLANSKIWLDGKKLPPASSVMASGQTDNNGICTFDSVPTGFDWWFEIGLGDRRSASSPSFTFESDTYNLVLQSEMERLTGKEIFALVSAKNGAGDDLTGQLVHQTPSQQPPMAEQDQAQGRELLSKLFEVNRYWLGSPPEQIKSYAYDFHLTGKPKQRVSIGSGTIYQRRGISYLSALDHMTRNPEIVIFRSIDAGADKIELVYSFKTRQKVSAGNGVSGSWRGYFSMGVSDGTLLIDAKTFTPIEHRTKGLIESYSNFVPVDDDGHQVPLRIQIDKMNFDWTFKWYPDGLWLFDQSAPAGPGQEPVVKVSNVMITSADDRTPQPTKFDVLDSLIKAREVEADRLRAQIQALQKENPDLAKGFQRQLDVLMEEQARVIAARKQLQDKVKKPAGSPSQ